MKHGWNIRTIYLYLVSFVALLMIIIGSVQVIQNAVDFVYYPAKYYSGPEVGAPPGGQTVALEVIAEQKRADQERWEQQMRYDRAQRFAKSLALLLVALPIYFYHWRRIQKDALLAAQGDQSEQ